ncbi:MAG: hypothetical protein QOC63_1649 [Mycobacterium sp.]|nr:hypothetical protein [Mycobacterium sp.]
MTIGPPVRFRTVNSLVIPAVVAAAFGAAGSAEVVVMRLVVAVGAASVCPTLDTGCPKRRVTAATTQPSGLSSGVGAPGAALGPSPTNSSKPVSRFGDGVVVAVSATGVTARDTSAAATACVVTLTAAAFTTAGVVAAFTLGATVNGPSEGDDVVANVCGLGS